MKAKTVFCFLFAFFLFLPAFAHAQDDGGDPGDDGGGYTNGGGGGSVTMPGILNAFVYVGTPALKETYYIQTEAKGSSDTDLNAWFALTNGYWTFSSLWIDSLTTTLSSDAANNYSVSNEVIEGQLDNGAYAIVTLTWKQTTVKKTGARSYSLQLKMTDYNTGKVLNGVDTYAAPLTVMLGVIIIN